jgi:Ubiquitin-associated protein 2
MGPRGGATSFRDQNSHRTPNSNYRSNNINNNINQDQQEIDNWDPASTQVATSNDNGKGDETWGDCGDWDNEEYTGSLSDTKVFTPSGATQSSGQDLAAPPGLEQQILNPPSQNDVPQYSATVASSTATAGALNNGGGQYGEMHSATTAAAHLRQALEMPQALSAEQSQYFNTLGSQNTGSAYPSSVQYPFNDGTNQQAPRQQQRPRARVPPPSKIPSSAVEMPGDGLNVYLGVQFGELDFGTGTEESYETEKYAPGMDQQGGDEYSNNKGTGVSKGSQSSGLGGLQPSITDSISSSAQADLSSGYAQRNPNSSSMGTAGGQSALDQLTKPADIYNSGTTAGGNNYQNLSYSAAQKSGGYQTGGYGGNAYNNSQASSNYPPSSSNTYGYNQNSYQQQSQGTQSGTGQQQTQTTGSGVSSGTTNQPANNSSG